jgi:hypothetical protein
VLIGNYGAAMDVKIKRRLSTGVFIFLSFVGGMYVCRYVIRAYMIEINKTYAYSWITKIREAENIFKSKYGRYGSLADLASSGVLAKYWVQTSKWDYRFEVIVTANGYEASAIPAPERTKNIVYSPYFLDESGIIRRDVK